MNTDVMGELWGNEHNPISINIKFSAVICEDISEKRGIVVNKHFPIFPRVNSSRRPHSLVEHASLYEHPETKGSSHASNKSDRNTHDPPHGSQRPFFCLITPTCRRHLATQFIWGTTTSRRKAGDFRWPLLFLGNPNDVHGRQRHPPFNPTQHSTPPLDVRVQLQMPHPTPLKPAKNTWQPAPSQSKTSFFQVAVASAKQGTWANSRRGERLLLCRPHGS